MTQINAYLSFNGNCRDAMTFYKECLGGELMLQAVEGSPAADKMPAAFGPHILHSTLTNGDLLLMASDMVPEELVQGNTVSLSLNCSSQEEIETLFSHLSAGGKITHPLADEFWGATFGALIDKFGMNWLLNYDKPPKE